MKTLVRLITVLVAATVLVACSPTEGGQSVPNREIVEHALLNSFDRVEQATVQSTQSGFAAGLLLNLVVADASPLTAQELTATLLDARDASTNSPDYMDLVVVDGDGEPVDVRTAADELEVPWTEYSTGLSVTRLGLDEVFGPRVEDEE